MASIKAIDSHDIDKVATPRQVSAERGTAGLSSSYTLGMSMRRTFASKAMLAALSIPGLASTGCLPDFLTEEELNAKIAAAQCAADAGSIKDGSCYIPGLGDTSEFGDSNTDGSRRGGDSSDAGSTDTDTVGNDTIGEDAADVADTTDTSDGTDDAGDAADTSDTSDGTDEVGDVADTSDTSDGTDDVGDVADTTDTSDGTDDVGDVADTSDTSDGTDDVGDVADTSDTSDGTDDVGDVADTSDTSDGTDDASDVADTSDTSDGSTDDASDVAPDNGDTIGDADSADLDGDGTADGSSDSGPEAEVNNPDADADTTDVQQPKTCDGQPVGTLQFIPTKGPKGETGICKDGARWCSETGAWVIIKQSVDPAPKELCNGQDDTCEGNTDEGFKVVQPVSYDPLKIGKGKCVAAVWDCINGQNKEFSSEVGPKAETCNAFDDDCDGFPDNGLPTKKYFTEDPAKIGVGICKEGKKDCNPMTGAYEVTLLESLPAVKGEICTNLVDDNCDGQTDEAKCSCDANADGFVDLDKFDPDFLNAVLTFLGKGPNDKITEAEALQIKELKLQGKNITNISGVECFTGLTKLDLYDNALIDISPLKNLIGLISLGLSANDISDISPLSGLVNLESLALHTNSVSDIQALGGMINLNELYLFNNKVTNISVLKDLIKLFRLELGGNNVSDISPLAGMSTMNQLGLNDNKISNLAALAKLTGLTEIDLTNNLVSDITALINNGGLKTGDSVWLKGNPQIPASQINSLKGKGVKVYW